MVHGSANFFCKGTESKYSRLVSHMVPVVDSLEAQKQSR